MNVDMNALQRAILMDADDRRISAGYQGSYNDGGASTLEMQVKFYNYGRQGVVPSEWNGYMSQLDSEYQKYLELRKKFGNIR